LLVNAHLDPCNYDLIYWAGSISYMCLQGCKIARNKYQRKWLRPETESCWQVL